MKLRDLLLIILAISISMNRAIADPSSQPWADRIIESGLGKTRTALDKFKEGCDTTLSEFHEKIIRPDSGMRGSRADKAQSDRYGTMGSLLREMKDYSEAFCQLSMKRATAETRNEGLGGEADSFIEIVKTARGSLKEISGKLCSTYRTFEEYLPERKLQLIARCRNQFSSVGWLSPQDFSHLASELRRYRSARQGRNLAPFLANIRYMCSSAGKKDKRHCSRSGY